MKQSRSFWSLQKSTPWLAICVVMCIAVGSRTSGQESELVNVQPAIINGGDVRLYGVIRELPDYLLIEGSVLAIQITASNSDLTTEARRESQGAPCAFCTAMHYFLVSEANERRPEIFRMVPGPVTYIHIDKKEYMLGRVDLGWVEDKPRLKRVTLLQTGFAPPLFKRRINIRFEDPVEFAIEAEKIADMAMRDAFTYSRPVTLQKVFPPGNFEEINSGSE